MLHSGSLDSSTRSRILFNLASLLLKEERIQESLSYIQQSIEEDLTQPIDQSFNQTLALYTEIILLFISRSGDFSLLSRLTHLSETLKAKLHSVQITEFSWIQTSLKHLDEVLSLIQKWELVNESNLQEWLKTEIPPIFKLRKFIDNHSPLYFSFLLADHRMKEAVSILTRDTPTESAHKLFRLLSHHLTFSYASTPVNSLVDRSLSREETTSLLRQVASLFPSMVPSDFITFPRESDDNDEDLFLKLRSIRSITSDHTSSPSKPSLYPYSRDSIHPHSREFPRDHRRRLQKQVHEDGSDEIPLKRRRNETEEVMPVTEADPEIVTIPSQDSVSLVHEPSPISSSLSVSCCCILSGQEFRSVITLTEMASFTMIEKEIRSLLMRICVSE